MDTYPRSAKRRGIGFPQHEDRLPRSLLTPGFKLLSDVFCVTDFKISERAYIRIIDASLAINPIWDALKEIRRLRGIVFLLFFPYN
jgi:hypothetical protein